MRKVTVRAGPRGYVGELRSRTGKGMPLDTENRQCRKEDRMLANVVACARPRLTRSRAGIVPCRLKVDTRG
jgi:hypothetical protein